MAPRMRQWSSHAQGPWMHLGQSLGAVLLTPGWPFLPVSYSWSLFGGAQDSRCRESPSLG